MLASVSAAMSTSLLPSVVIQRLPEQYLPIIHLVFANLKTWLIGIHHGVSHQHLQAYLNEFTFRFNRRFYRQGTLIFGDVEIFAYFHGGGLEIVSSSHGTIDRALALLRDDLAANEETVEGILAKFLFCNKTPYPVKQWWWQSDIYEFIDGGIWWLRLHELNKHIFLSAQRGDIFGPIPEPMP